MGNVNDGTHPWCGSDRQRSLETLTLAEPLREDAYRRLMVCLARQTYPDLYLTAKVMSHRPGAKVLRRSAPGCRRAVASDHYERSVRLPYQEVMHDPLVAYFPRYSWMLLRRLSFLFNRDERGERAVPLCNGHLGRVRSWSYYLRAHERSIRGGMARKHSL